jgi:hypothetical protein
MEGCYTVADFEFVNIAADGVDCACDIVAGVEGFILPYYSFPVGLC